MNRVIKLKRKLLNLMICLTFVSSILLSGCSLFNDKEVEVALKKPVPLTIEEIVAYEGEGQYAGDKYDQKKVEVELDKLPEGLTSKEIYGYLLSLVGENYKQYKEMFDQVDPNFKQEMKDINPTAPNGTAETLNVEVILDASGSMAQSVPGGVKMDLAKSSIRDFLKSLPPSANVGLRVLGHKGSGADKDKQLSCSQTELVYGLEPFNESRFNGVLNSFAPKGWTGIAKALEEAQKDLASKQGPGVKNMIYLVSDGIETCGGDPVATAKALHQSNVAAVVNIIGFDVDNQAQQQLKSVANAGGGSYVTVKDATSLKEAFQDQIDELKKMNFDWLSQAKGNINDGYRKYMKINQDAYSKMTRTNLNEIDRSKKIRDYLKEQKRIDSNQWSELNSFIQNRFDLIVSYKQKRYDENTDKIYEQSNWDEVDRQFDENSKRIEEFEQGSN